MELKLVRIDTAVAKWASDQRLKDFLLGKQRAFKDLKSKKWQPCSIELEDDLFEGLQACKENLEQGPYRQDSSKIVGTSEIHGPIWSEEDHFLYIGQISNGQLSGLGVLIAFRGSKFSFAYEGHFDHDKPNGLGRAIYSNGDWYIGQFSEGQAKGKGKYRNNQSKCTLEGDFDHDLPHGHVIEIWDDGSTFEGEFEHGHKHGKGTLKTKWGILQGNFQKGEFHGEGSLKSTSDRIYEGVWIDSALKSPAKISLEDHVYEGHVNADLLPEGKGTVKNSRQKVHGVFKDGYIQGEVNSIELTTGKSYVGYYEKGILESAIRGETEFHEEKSPERQPLDPKHPILTSGTPKPGTIQSPSKPEKDKDKKTSCCCC